MLIYSLSDSSHSSEEHLKSLVVTTFFSFLMYLNSPKNTCRLEQNQIYITDQQISLEPALGIFLI